MRNEDLGHFVFGKLPPHSVEMEEAVLGGLLSDHKAIHKIDDMIRPDDFYKGSNANVAKAMFSLHKQDKTIDMLTVAEEMKQLGLAVDIPYIVSLTNKVASTANIEAHARIVLEKSLQRKIINISTKAIRGAYEETIDFFDTLKTLEENISEINNRIGQKSQTLEDVLDEMTLEHKEIFDNDGAMVGRYFSSLKSLDELIQGLRGNTFLAFGGRPGAGKSSFLNSVIDHHVEHDNKMWLWSGEMTTKQTSARYLSFKTEMGLSEIEMGKYYGDQEKFDSYANVDQMMRDNQDSLHFVEGIMSIGRFKSEVIKYKAMGVDLFCIDRLYLFSEIKSERNPSIQMGIAKSLCDDLRSICNTYSVNIILFAQLNGEIDKRATKYPMLSDFYGRTGIQSAVNAAIIINRPDMYDLSTFPHGKYEGSDAEGFAELVVVKNTFGAEDSALTKFKGKNFKFQEYSEDPIADWGNDIDVKLPSNGDLPF